MGALIFWDLNESLVRADNAHLPFLLSAIRERVAIDATTVPTFDSARLTDQGLVVQALLADGCAHAEVRSCTRRILQRYAELYADARFAVAETLAEYPGVRNVLAMADYEGAYVSVVTRRTTPVALVQLNATRMTRELDIEIGAFGNDADERRALLQVGRDRVGKLRDMEFDDEEVWLFCSSAEAVRNGTQHNINVIAFAIGDDDSDALIEAGATRVFDDFSDVDGIRRIIFSR